MKAFHFPLEHVLRLRRSQLEIERGRVQQLNFELATLQRAALDLQSQAINARSWTLRNSPVSSGDLQSMPAFQQRMQMQIVLARGRQADLEARLGIQRKTTLEVERQVRLLEELRDKRFREWSGAVEAEHERFASEAFLARWEK